MCAQILWCQCRCRTGRNFGDVITPYLYHRVTGKHSTGVCHPGTPEDPVYMGAGSIMSHCHRMKHVVVWGTGIMFTGDRFQKPTDVLSVRGPLTRRRFLQLGYSDCPEEYGDIGLLLPRVYMPHNTEKRYRLGVVPHYVDYATMKAQYGGSEDVLVVDLCEPVEHVVDQLVQCERTISTSLHGIIASHAYGVPCAWARISERIAGGFTKYHDYYGSLVHMGAMEAPDDGYEALRPVCPGKWTTDEVCKAVDAYPQPTFPIDTERMWALCPFVQQ
jgi:hypothetical protein